MHGLTHPNLSIHPRNVFAKILTQIIRMNPLIKEITEADTIIEISIVKKKRNVKRNRKQMPFKN